MPANSRPSDRDALTMPDLKQELIKEAKRLGQDDCRHSEVAHFFAARIWRAVHYVIGGSITILGALIGVSEFRQWDETSQLSGALAIVIAALGALAVFLNPQGRAQIHHTKGNHYNALRGRLRRFAKIDCIGGDTDKDLANLLNKLAAQKDRLNEEGPAVPSWAYRLAKRGIERGETDYATDVDRD